MVGGGNILNQDGAADPIITRMVDEDTVPWWKKKNLRWLYLMLFPTCMGIEMTSGFDSQIINAVQLIPPWQTYFGTPGGSLKGIISASYNLGAICALPFIPLINDRFGRRWCIMFGSLVMVLGAFLQGFSNGVGMYIVARLLLGFGIPFCIIAGSCMIGEIAYPKERPILTSLFNASWFIGSIIAAGIAFGTQKIQSDWAWRIPSLLQIAPSAIQIILVFFIPESPRFLVSKDKHEEALAILIKYHAEGDESSEFARAEYAQIKTTIELDLELSKRSWMDMLSTSGMRKRVLIATFLGLFTQWSGNTLISYYLNDLLTLIGYTDPNVKGKINVGNTCWSLVNGVTIALLVRRFRRRSMYLTCTFALLSVYIGWTISTERFLATGDSGVAKLVIFWIFAYSPAYNIGYNALTYTYMVELFPYATRARGIAIFQFFGRGAGFFTTFVNPIGLEAIKWKWLLTYVCWLAFEIVVVFFLFPETSGRTLEELAFLFEDKALAEQATMAVEKQIHGGEEVVEKDGETRVEVAAEPKRMV
ncbi:general substrate transporter [Patellaria atrata CBS 101060]|uniref:General substrate transporter n=1 Tax=Patellaria atrata CBS 101060 TaxID=1346257 RepID=A0A9P4SG26_9PEZI|nr:general substrate transporter [Patellaria atrata CBS 101060]